MLLAEDGGTGVLLNLSLHKTRVDHTDLNTVLLDFRSESFREPSECELGCRIGCSQTNANDSCDRADVHNLSMLRFLQIGQKLLAEGDLGDSIDRHHLLDCVKIHLHERGAGHDPSIVHKDVNVVQSKLVNGRYTLFSLAQVHLPDLDFFRVETLSLDSLKLIHSSSCNYNFSGTQSDKVFGQLLPYA